MYHFQKMTIVNQFGNLDIGFYMQRSIQILYLRKKKHKYQAKF